MPSNAMVQIPMKQLTLGKSGMYVEGQPGEVAPVASLGAAVAGFECPLATK